VLGEGKAQLLNVPLMGRESSKNGNWMDGRPVRVQAFRIPKDPVKDKWEPVTVNEDLHVVHNFHPIDRADGKGADVLMASYEGVNLL
ncbi:hypothetical protein, partial [Enterococcus faecium]|uniref:hypothetical protein n=1 Tax=Enterococcus faecium TaxID=1352 RepID=UPI003F426F84